MAKSLSGKLGSLRRKVRSMDSALVAFSGGVDSAVLLRVCREELGEKAIAVTMLSDDYPSEDLTMAKRIAKVVGVKHITMKGKSCESESNYKELRKVARKLKIHAVLNGSHADDYNEESDNLEAARRNGTRSPMLECGLSKQDIRMLARKFQLPNWRKKQSGLEKVPFSKAKTRTMKEFLSGLDSSIKVVSVRGRTLQLHVGAGSVKKFSAISGRILKRARSLGITKTVITIKA